VRPERECRRVRLRGQPAEAAINLKSIGADDLRVTLPSHSGSEVRFPARRWADDVEDPFHRAKTKNRESGSIATTLPVFESVPY
jgi:hypothetical protein